MLTANLLKGYIGTWMPLCSQLSQESLKISLRKCCYCFPNLTANKKYAIFTNQPDSNGNLHTFVSEQHTNRISWNEETREGTQKTRKHAYMQETIQFLPRSRSANSFQFDNVDRSRETPQFYKLWYAVPESCSQTDVHVKIQPGNGDPQTWALTVWLGGTQQQQQEFKRTTHLPRDVDVGRIHAQLLEMSWTPTHMMKKVEILIPKSSL